MSRLKRSAGLAAVAGLALLAGCGSAPPDRRGRPRRRRRDRGQDPGGQYPSGQYRPAGRHVPRVRAAGQLLVVRAAGDFEGYLSFGTGLSARGGYRISSLAGPDRVVIDVLASLSRSPG